MPCCYQRHYFPLFLTFENYQSVSQSIIVLDAACSCSTHVHAMRTQTQTQTQMQMQKEARVVSHQSPRQKGQACGWLHPTPIYLNLRLALDLLILPPTTNKPYKRPVTHSSPAGRNILSEMMSAVGMATQYLQSYYRAAYRSSLIATSGLWIPKSVT